jgi:hypothetical protein
VRTQIYSECYDEQTRSITCIWCWIPVIYSAAPYWSGRRVKLITSQPSVNRMPRKCRILNVTHSYRLPRAVIRIFLLYLPKYNIFGTWQSPVMILAPGLAGHSVSQLLLILVLASSLWQRFVLLTICTYYVVRKIIIKVDLMHWVGAGMVSCILYTN